MGRPILFSLILIQSSVFFGQTGKHPYLWKEIKQPLPEYHLEGDSGFVFVDETFKSTISCVADTNRTEWDRVLTSGDTIGKYYFLSNKNRYILFLYFPIVEPGGKLLLEIDTNGNVATIDHSLFTIISKFNFDPNAFFRIGNLVGFRTKMILAEMYNERIVLFDEVGKYERNYLLYWRQLRCKGEMYGPKRVVKIQTSEMKICDEKLIITRYQQTFYYNLNRSKKCRYRSRKKKIATDVIPIL